LKKKKRIRMKPTKLVSALGEFPLVWLGFAGCFGRVAVGGDAAIWLEIWPLIAGLA
jgi:hypothetical protein